MAKRELREMTITPGENGGAVVEHRYKPTRQERTGNISHYPEPEQHIFGPKDEGKMMAHVREHLNIKGGGDDE